MSDSKEMQIIPPARLPADAHRPNGYGLVSVSRVNPGGIINSTITRWEANRHARTINALSNRVRAETELFDAQTQALGSYIKRQRAFQELQELPEILANDRECRRAERAERLRQYQHASEMTELKRATEVAYGQTALLDARQALKAQRDFGSAALFALRVNQLRNFPSARNTKLLGSKPLIVRLTVRSVLERADLAGACHRKWVVSI